MCKAKLCEHLVEVLAHISSSFKVEAAEEATKISLAISIKESRTSVISC